jgi:ATP-binding cassette subfamily B protein
MTTSRYTNFALCRRLLRQATPYWPHIMAIFLLSLLPTPLRLLTSLPLKITDDSVIGSHGIADLFNVLLPAANACSDTAVLMLAAGLLVAISLLVRLQRLGSWLLQIYTGEQLVLDFQARLFHHVRRLSLSYHDAKGTTDSAYRIHYDAPAIQWMLANGVSPFVTSDFTLVGMVYVTAWIDWQLALVALTVSPVLFLLTRASSQRLRSRWYKVKELQTPPCPWCKRC